MVAPAACAAAGSARSESEAALLAPDTRASSAASGSFEFLREAGFPGQGFVRVRVRVRVRIRVRVRVRVAGLTSRPLKSMVNSVRSTWLGLGVGLGLGLGLGEEREEHLVRVRVRGRVRVRVRGR